MQLGGDDGNWCSCSQSLVIEMSVVELSADVSDCKAFSFSASSLVNTLDDLEVSDLEDREEANEARGKRVCGTADGSLREKGLGGGGVIDLGDERGLESGE